MIQLPLAIWHGPAAHDAAELCGCLIAAFLTEDGIQVWVAGECAPWWLEVYTKIYAELIQGEGPEVVV